jgi:hypothetical protein
MNERLCDTCEHFSPALTCMRKPSWGLCKKAANGPPAGNVPKTKLSFTWADHRCDSFRPRDPS